MKNLLIGITFLCMFLAGAPAFADNDVAFAYQGRVKVQGQPFNGSGEFKFSIVDTAGETTLWSNDGLAENGGAPTSHLTLPVEDGIFNVIVGDTSLGMSPINATIFNSQTPLKLRVWFNDGTRGFQQLNPDHNLVNLALTALQTSTQDFTIYVNGQNGDDKNNGLTLDSAKKTIQAAVDTLPERVRCNVTIDVADGTYRESVRIFGTAVEPGKAVIIVGDESWTPGGGGSPAVRITGTDNDAAPSRVREFGISAVQCSGVNIKGLAVDNFAVAGLQMDNGIYTVQNCRVTASNQGVVTSDSKITLNDISISGCSADGMYIFRHAAADIRNCSSTSNGGSGLHVNAGATVNLQGSGNYSSNAANGYKVQHHSGIVFSQHIPYSGTVSRNGQYGLYILYQSYSENHTANNWGTGNSAGNIGTLFGGMTTY